MIEGIIGDFFEIKGGKRLPKGSAFSPVKTQYPYLRVTDFKRNGLNTDGIKYIYPETQSCIQNYTVDAGTVYISIAGTIGVAGIVPNEFGGANLTENAAKFVPKKGTLIYNKFLSYFLNSFEVQNIIKAKTMAVGVPKLALFRIKEIPIRLPGIAEQQKIAAILDAADQLRQKDQQMVKHYTALGPSLFLEMFGNPVSNPKEWEKSFCIDHSQCIVPGRDKPKSFSGEIPWVTTNDLSHLAYTHGSSKNIGLTDDEIKNAKSRVIPQDSIILTCVGDLGVVSINSKPVVVNQQLHTFQCDQDHIAPIFMMYALSYQKPYMLKMSSSTTVPYMNKTVCNNIPMVYPPIGLQNQFARHVELIEKQKQQAQAALDKSETLFNSLLQRAFKGELTQSDKAQPLSKAKGL